MNIIGLSNQYAGCGYHRVLLPLGFMDGIKGYVTNMITEEKVQQSPGVNWDILLYNRVSVYDADWDEMRQILGCKVVLDLDDYWVLPPNHMNYHEYKSMGDRIENNIRLADMVTVTNEQLAEKVRPFNSNVHIFPNALPFGRNQFIEDRRQSNRVRIFWAGGVSHEADIKMLRNPIQRLKIHADKIQMVIGGYAEGNIVTPIWDRMFSAFTAGGTLPYMKLHGVPPNQYMQMYENADIMVIPLEDSEWHGCKSNLKILEAACKRIPVIVSNVAPYNKDSDAPVFWVNSQKDWFYHLNYLICNPEAREDYGNKLYEWAKEKYNLTDINQRRAAAFRSLCEARTPAHVLSAQ